MKRQLETPPGGSTPKTRRLASNGEAGQRRDLRLCHECGVLATPDCVANHATLPLRAALKRSLGTSLAEAVRLLQQLDLELAVQDLLGADQDQVAAEILGESALHCEVSLAGGRRLAVPVPDSSAGRLLRLALLLAHQGAVGAAGAGVHHPLGEEAEREVILLDSPRRDKAVKVEPRTAAPASEHAEGLQPESPAPSPEPSDQPASHPVKEPRSSPAAPADPVLNAADCSCLCDSDDDGAGAGASHAPFGRSSSSPPCSSGGLDGGEASQAGPGQADPEGGSDESFLELLPIELQSKQLNPAALSRSMGWCVEKTCRMQCATWPAYREHCASAHPPVLDQWRCHLCLRVFGRQISKHKHLAIDHSKSKEHLCPSCAASFVCRMHLNEHTKKYHKKKVV